MAVPTLLELAESGAHFGHHRSLIYPKANSYVFAVKNNVALIDLEQTQEAIVGAQKVIADYRKQGKTILFVGTKRSVRTLVREVAESINALYITERWFGGTLTNFSTMKETLKRMNELQDFLGSPKATRLSKKERLTRERRLHRYERFLKGLTGLKAMPDLLVLASASDDAVAIAEANQLGIPVMAIMDTDMNPDKIAYPIPANDDAPKAIELILTSIVSMPGSLTKTKAAVAAKKETVTETEAEVAEDEAIEEKLIKKSNKKTETSKEVAEQKAVKAAVAKKTGSKETVKKDKKEAAAKPAAKKVTRTKTTKEK